MDSETVSQCDNLQPWLAAYALGEAEAAPEVLGHLSLCPRCRNDLRGYRAVAGLLPYDAPESDPSPALRERLIGAVTQAAAAQAQPRGAPQLGAPRSTRARWAWPQLARARWAAYAFAALAVALLGWNISLHNQLAAQTAQISANRQSWQTMIALLNDTSLRWYNVSGAEAQGHFWLSPQGQVACLVAQRLPELPPGQTYQVWLVQGAEPASGGTFDAHNGSGWVLVQAGEPIGSYHSIFVTIEPQGGSALPGGPRVLDGNLTAGASPAIDRAELQNLVRATFSS